MAQRVLLVEESRPVAAALRRHLEGAGFRVDQAGRGEALSRLEPGHALAVVRADGQEGSALAEALKAADPELPVVQVFEDEEDAAAAALVADGVLVGPLTQAAVVSLCRAMARQRAQAARIAARERSRAPAPGDLEFLRRLLLMEVRRSRRYRYPVSLALAAVDRWGQLSARLDGRARAAFLGGILGVVSRSVRDIDLALPYSAGRLLVLMPHTGADGALEVANRIVSRVRAHRGRERVTASVGVATFDGQGAVSFGSLTRGAAEALSRAQASGGDRAEGAAGPRRKRDRVVIG